MIIWRIGHRGVKYNLVDFWEVYIWYINYITHVLFLLEDSPHRFLVLSLFHFAVKPLSEKLMRSSSRSTFEMVTHCSNFRFSATSFASARICCTSMGSGWRRLIYNSWLPWNLNFETVSKVNFKKSFYFLIRNFNDKTCIGIRPWKIHLNRPNSQLYVFARVS